MHKVGRSHRRFLSEILGEKNKFSVCKYMELLYIERANWLGPDPKDKIERS